MLFDQHPGGEGLGRIAGEHRDTGLGDDRTFVHGRGDEVDSAAMLGDAGFDTTVGDAFVAEVDRQVREDKPIWENKAYLPRPALADTDGPVTKFRKWASQFYAEGVVDSQDFYPPSDSYPAEDLGLSASQKYGSAPIA